jgi:two-component system response regulator
LGDGKLPLLHVDDSADDRFLVKEAITLTKTPFTYHEADGLESAMPFFQFHGYHGELEQRPALVLLDYALGGSTTGVDFLYWLRFRKKITSLPVVMFSGSPGTGHIAECYDAGADHYLTKPNELERLKRIVRTLYVGLVSRPPGPIPLLSEYRLDPRDLARKAT